MKLTAGILEIYFCWMLTYRSTVLKRYETIENQNDKYIHAYDNIPKHHGKDSCMKKPIKKLPFAMT